MVACPASCLNRSRSSSIVLSSHCQGTQVYPPSLSFFSYSVLAVPLLMQHGGSVVRETLEFRCPAYHARASIPLMHPCISLSTIRAGSSDRDWPSASPVGAFHRSAVIPMLP